MRIRIKFRKYGVMRFIGHLDIMRYFQKAMRRAGIDIAYSEGFSPHQIMSFAAPLGVGITSDGEYLDIEVHSTASSAESLRALNAVMVEGVEVTEYVALPDTAKKAMTSVAAADYFVYCKDSFTDAFAAEELPDRIRAYYEERDSIEVTKQTKKSERVMDLKPLIYAFEFRRMNERDGYFLRLCTGSTDNVKPELVLSDFYQFFGKGYEPLHMQIHRLEVYEKTEDGFEPLYQAGREIEA